MCKCKCEFEYLLIKDFEKVSSLLVDNKLSLHLGKTESILIGSRNQVKKGENLNII
jgi:hypothetical protein